MKNILLIIMILIINNSIAQTWNLLYSTDSTHIRYFLNGPNNKPTYYGDYQCDSCPQKRGALVAEFDNNLWKPVISYSTKNTTFDLVFGAILNYLNQDSLIAYNKYAFFRSSNRGIDWSKILIDSLTTWPVFFNTSNTRTICFSDKITIFDNAGTSFKIIKPFNNEKYLNNLNLPSQISRKGKSFYWARRYRIRPNTDTCSIDVLHSIDNGETWTTIPVPVAFKPWDYSNICIAQTKENEGFISITGPVNALSQYDYLMRFKGDSIYTNDHITIDSFAKNNWIAITGMHFYNNCEGLITTFSEYHYKTADGGTTWHRTEAAPALQFNLAAFIDSACVLYDGGFSSASQKTPLIVNFTNGGAPYPSQTGCVVKPATGVQIKAPQPVHIYPNPFGETLTFELPQSNAPYHIDVYSITGQLLMQQEATTGKNVLNTSALAHGMYLVQVSNSRINYTQKLIK